MPDVLIQTKEFLDAKREALDKGKKMLALDNERKAAVNEDGTLDATKWTDARAEEYDRLGAEALAAQTHAEELKRISDTAEYVDWAESPASDGSMLQHGQAARQLKTLRQVIFGEEPEKFMAEASDGQSQESFMQKGRKYDTQLRLSRKDASYGAAIGTGNAVDQLVIPDYTGALTPYPIMPTVADKLFGAGRTNVFVWKYFLQDKPTFGAAEVGMTLTGQTTKPMTTNTFELATEQTHVVAHYEPIHKTALANIPQLESIIREQLLIGLRLRVDYQLVWGNGQGDNILGLYNRGVSPGGLPGIQQFTSTGVTNTQFYDDLKHMATKSYMKSYIPATVAGMTPFEEDLLLTAKTAGSGQYVYGVVPFTDGSGTTVLKVWGLELVISPVFMNPTTAAGSVFVGNPMFGKVVTQDDLNITVGWVDKQFIQNAETLLGETTVGLEVSRPYGWQVMDLPNVDGIS